MRVTVLGSGSRGNAVLVATAAGKVLVDAGFPPSVLEERAEAAGSTLEGLTAVLLTHEHGDHARSAAAVARAFGCPIYASAGTIRALAFADVDTRAVRPAASTDVGPVRVEAVPVSHDAAEPLALLVTDPTSGVRLGIVYDVGRGTPRLTRLLRNAHCLLLEANHDDQLLRTGPYPAAVRSRIAGPTGHLSNWQAAQFVAGLCHEELQTVVLVHLSERCNRPDVARDTVQSALTERGFTGGLLVAQQDRPLPTVTVHRGQLALQLDD